MDPTVQLHLVAGLASFALAIAVLVRAPARTRNRLLAALALSIAVWTLAVGAWGVWPRWGEALRRIYVIGSCAAAPLGLHLAFALSGLGGRARTVLLAAAWAAVAGLYAAAWIIDPGGPAWKAAALVVLGTILALALVLLALHYGRQPLGPTRSATGWLLVGGIVAVVGGLSDFLPRDRIDLPTLGPVSVLFFVAVASSGVLGQRYLAIPAAASRGLALVASAALAAVLLRWLVGAVGADLPALFVVMLALALLLLPALRRLFASGRAWSGSSALVRTITGFSQRLPAARSRTEVWQAVDDARATLAEDLRLAVWGREDSGAFVRVLPALPAERLAADAPLARLLLAERRAVSRWYLEGEPSGGLDAGLVTGALERFRRCDLQLAVPLLGVRGLEGWLELGGGDPRRYLDPQVAAALAAVGQQALATLDRLDADARERRSAALAAVGELAAGLAHELRNPVAAIHGAAQAISPRASAEQVREMIEVIREESERLGRVTGEFLDYARPGAGRGERVDLGRLAERVRRSAAAAGLPLDVEVSADGSHLVVEGDEEQLRRVFDNLVRNAAEATGPRGRLRVALRREDAAIEVRFEDDGPGVAPEAVERIFRPFQTTKPGGTGLGLALVHRIVEAHGGTASLGTSALGGAGFVLRLPAAADQATGEDG